MYSYCLSVIPLSISFLIAQLIFIRACHTLENAQYTTTMTWFNAHIGSYYLPSGTLEAWLQGRKVAKVTSTATAVVQSHGHPKSGVIVQLGKGSRGNRQLDGGLSMHLRCCHRTR